MLKNLTPKENEVLKSLSDGLTNEEIAYKLHVRVSTIKAHLSKVYLKMQLFDEKQRAVMRLKAALVYLKDIGRLK